MKNTQIISIIVDKFGENIDKIPPAQCATFISNIFNAMFEVADKAKDEGYDLGWDQGYNEAQQEFEEREDEEY